MRSLGDAELNPRGALIYGEMLIGLVLDSLRFRWRDDVRFLNSFNGRGDRILTLTARGADKGSALEVACADLGIAPSCVVAFGDSEADIEMFRVAGASMAMGQGSADVCEAATWVTTSCSDDGVGRGIERLLVGDVS